MVKVTKYQSCQILGVFILEWLLKNIVEGGERCYLTVAQNANGCRALKEVADVYFDERRGLGTRCTGCILGIDDTWYEKANMLSMPLFAHSGRRFKKKKKGEGIRPAVGDDGIGDDLNDNPAVPQSGADGLKAHDLLNATRGVGCESGDKADWK